MLAEVQTAKPLAVSDEEGGVEALIRWHTKEGRKRTSGKSTTVLGKETRDAGVKEWLSD